MRTSSTQANHLTQEQALAIISDRRNGLTITATASKYGFSKSFIQNTVKRGGPPPTRIAHNRIVISQKIGSSIVAMYRAGKTTRYLAKKFKMSTPLISKVLLNNGDIARRDPSTNRRVYRLNENVFDDANANPDAAYWIGFIMADGYVGDSKGAENLIQASASEIDKKHLLSLKRFLGSSRPLRLQRPKIVTSRGRQYLVKPLYELIIQSKHMAKVVRSYGIVPRKSHVAKVIGLENNRHFWRGVVDGDGSISTHRNRAGNISKGAAIRLCGSLFILEQFKTFLENSLPGIHVGTTWANGVWSVRVSGKSASDVARLLYNDCKTYLPRKRRLAKIITSRKFFIDQRRKKPLLCSV